MDASEPLTTLLTTAEAAELAGVSPATIRQWASRGHLTATSRDRRGHPLYLLLDVAKAERATRHLGRRDGAATAPARCGVCGAAAGVSATAPEGFDAHTRVADAVLDIATNTAHNPGDAAVSMLAGLDDLAAWEDQVLAFRELWESWLMVTRLLTDLVRLQTPHDDLVDTLLMWREQTPPNPFQAPV